MSLEHSEGSALLGTLRVTLRESTLNEAPHGFCTTASFRPSLALLPELHNSSIPPVAPLTLENVGSVVNLANSSWDVHAFNAFFRDGADGAAAAQRSGRPSVTGGGRVSGGGVAAAGQQQKRTVRDVLEEMIASGRLPGFSAAADTKSSSKQSAAASLPSVEQILADLAAFAAQVGAIEQEASALCTHHFLHFLGHQRLQQLTGALRFAGAGGTSTKSASVPPTLFTMRPVIQQQQQRRRQEDGGDASVSATETMQAERTELFAAVVKLLGLDGTDSATPNGGGSCSLWAQPPSKVSAATETEAPQRGVQPNPTAAAGVRHPAEQPVTVRLPRTCMAAAQPWTVSVRLVSSSAFAAAPPPPAVVLRIDAPQVVFGRGSSASARRGREQNESVDEPGEDLSSRFMPDRFHVDLGAIVRHLTRGEESGRHVSRQHFTLTEMQKSGDAGARRVFSMIASSLNMVRVNGEVVFTSSREVGAGDKIVVGSGARGASEVEIVVVQE